MFSCDRLWRFFGLSQSKFGFLGVLFVFWISEFDDRIDVNEISQHEFSNRPPPSLHRSSWSFPTFRWVT